MTKKNNEDFEDSTKCLIYDNPYVDGHIRVRDQCHIAGKCRGSEDRVCNINVKLNHEVPTVFHNLAFMQKLGNSVLT